MSTPLLTQVLLSVVDQALLLMISYMFSVLCLSLWNMEMSLFHFDKYLNKTRDYTTLDG